MVLIDLSGLTDKKRNGLYFIFPDAHGYLKGLSTPKRVKKKKTCCVFLNICDAFRDSGANLPGELLFSLYIFHVELAETLVQTSDSKSQNATQLCDDELRQRLG